MTADIEDLKDEERAKTAERASASWIPGLILIGLGVVFLLNSFFDVDFLDNWWALFILIPAATNLNNAWNRYREAGRWTESAIGALTGGVLIGFVALIFLFKLDWSIFWPVLLIILGAGILLRRG